MVEQRRASDLGPWERARGLVGTPFLLVPALVFLVDTWVYVAGSILLWMFALFLTCLVLAVLFLPRRIAMHHYRDRLYDHTKRITLVEQFLAGEAREHQRTLDLAQLDLDPLVTGGGGETGLGGMVKPATFLPRWANIRRVPPAWIPRRRDILRGEYVIHWTPLIEDPTTEFFERLARAVAHCWGLEPQMLVWNHWEVDIYHKLIVFRVAYLSREDQDYGALYGKYGPVREEDR